MTSVKKAKAVCGKDAPKIDCAILAKYPNIATKVAATLDELRKDDPKNSRAFYAAYYAVARGWVVEDDAKCVMAALGHTIGRHRKARAPKYSDLFSFTGVLQKGNAFVVTEERTGATFMFRHNREMEPVLVATSGQAHPGKEMTTAALAYAALYFKPADVFPFDAHTIKGMALTLKTGDTATVTACADGVMTFLLDSYEVSFIPGKTAVPVRSSMKCVADMPQKPSTKALVELKRIAQWHLRDTKTFQLAF